MLEAESTRLRLAAHWADLHCGEVRDRSGRVLPGLERCRRLGAPGTPAVMEFACAEFAAMQGMHPVAGENLVRDALNLRHRHPLLWARATAGEVRVWKAREVARLVGRAEFGLSLAQAQWIDAQTAGYLDTLAWSAFLELVEARIIETDPEAAEARRQAAAAERFVATGRTNEYGLKTVIAKAGAGEVIWFVAMTDRIAKILAEQGDTDPVDVRRSKAIGILADPARALRMLEAEPPSDDDERADDEQGARARPAGAGSGTVTGDPRPFVKPTGADPGRLAPATLYIHLSREAFLSRRGVARFEGVGPITVQQARDFLRHCNVTLTPVVDIEGQAPVSGYEVPDRMAEALHLRNPIDIFPFAVNRGRQKDKDHTRAYVAREDGGPPGQTRLDNLGPMLRFHHRIKTHGRWSLRQPEPGTYLWRTPHGLCLLVDHTGTHPLSRSLGDILWEHLDAPTTDLVRAG